MKKILSYIILLLLFIPVYCSAKIKYTDYYLFEKESKNYYEESDLLKKEELYYYLNYNYEISEEKYCFLNQNPDNLPILNQEDYIINTIKSKEYSNDSEGPFSTHYINDILKVKYIKLNNFISNQTSIEKITFYSGNEIIFYWIYDKNFYYNKIINNDSQIIIDLRDYYNINNLNIIIEFKSLELENIEFNLGVSNDLITYYTFHNKVLRSNPLELHKINFIIGEVPNENLTNYFIKEDVLYKYYNLKRVDSNVYTQKPLINYEHDITKYMKKYNYYKRDKIEIANEIRNIDDLIIKFSTIDILNISNLNLFENKIQNIKICLVNNICFTEDILINIKEKMRQKAKKNNLKNNISNLEIEKSITESEMLNLSKDIIIKTNNNYHKQYISILFGIFIIILTFLIIIKKRNRRNVELV